MHGNYKFKLEEWLPRFSQLLKPKLGERARKPIIYAARITSPFHICLNEWLRQVAQVHIDWGGPFPIDVFIMAKGEPKDRHVTKIGGLPYRPAGKPWPVSKEQLPMTFLAQICFSDSKDIVGKVPGDILLCFLTETEPPGSLHFEWYPVGLPDLVASEDVPDQPFQFPPCYGYIFRTRSFPDARNKPEYERDNDLDCGNVKIRYDYLLPQYQATQIGTAPWFIQFDDDRNAIKGRLLCTINSVEPSIHERYPWINQSKPLYPRSQTRFDDYKYMAIGDAGCVYISMDDDGRMYSHMSCY